MTRADDLYEQEMGGPGPALPEEHPDRWQWEYRGTKGERDELLDRLELEEPAAVHAEQEELF